jgi:hypothetical protein
MEKVKQIKFSHLVVSPIYRDGELQAFRLRLPKYADHQIDTTKKYTVVLEEE